MNGFLKAVTISEIGLIIVASSFGCSKKATNTASQGLDVPQTQGKEVHPATENAPPSQDSVVKEHPMTHDMGGMEAVSPEAALKDIYFDYDTPLIRKDMKGVLDGDADLLNKKKGVKVKIEGYCDERGTGEYNLALGNKRAYSVKKFLIAEGVESQRLSTISYGKEKPVCTEHNEDCYKLNRRAHLNVQ
jgi:peptidoglycan-associated lipoprotein